MHGGKNLQMIPVSAQAVARRIVLYRQMAICSLLNVPRILEKSDNRNCAASPCSDNDDDWLDEDIEEILYG
jgi:hypothetical protein